MFLHVYWCTSVTSRLTQENSRISQGIRGLSGPAEVQLLRDLDQPFIIEVTTRKGRYRLEWYDTSSPDCWKLLRPNLVVICYDISQRMSLINLQRLV